MSVKVVAVNLRRRASVTETEELCVVPDEAQLTWSGGQVHEVRLKFLCTGEGGDVFEAVGAPYVLKVLQPELHEVLGGKTVGARPGALEKVMANIYGVLTNTWPGKSVGVVVVERVPHAMRSWLFALITWKPIPDTISVDLVFKLTAQF